LLDAILVLHVAIERERELETTFEDNGRYLEKTETRSFGSDVSSATGLSRFPSHALKRLEQSI
jgi:hypothetical protein